MKANKYQKYISKPILIAVILGVGLGWLFFNSGGNANEHQHEHDQQETTEEVMYTCSMHPQIRQNKPGTCPICSMDLVPVVKGGATGDHIHPNEIEMTESALALASVETTVVAKGAPRKTIELLGKVEADERNVAALTARYGGRIEQLYINFTGQQVKKGEKLATIYSPELITAQKELIEAAHFKESNPHLYNAAFNKLRLWDVSESQIKAIEQKGEPQTYVDILSPIAGTVMQKQVAIGDYVKEGASLFEVIDLSKVWVMFEAYESDLPWISKGDQVDVTMASMPGKKFSAQVSYIDPFVDAKTRVALVRVELNNANSLLKPGMFANGELISKIAAESKELLIPKSAILWTGRRAVVYVKVSDRENVSFIYREVILGPEAGDYYVIADGLTEGEEVATNGVFKIDAAAQLAGKQSMMNPQNEQAAERSSHEHMDMNRDSEMKSMNMATDTFKVWGNCGMCKETIETAVNKLNGITHADWNQDTKMFMVTYDANKTSLQNIHKTIANVGYDTELETADDEVYNSLPECCHYDRK